MRGFFVTGTDTGAGKSIVAAAACAALRAQGVDVAAWKPVVTGLDEPAGDWPYDHELLAAASGVSVADVTSATFGPPASPHLVAGDALRLDDLVVSARRVGARADVVVIEGVGGLLVPLSMDASVRDLAVAVGLPLVVAARPGLGTINHCLLTVEAARAAGLRVAGIVFSGWPSSPSAVEESNRSTVAELTGVPVSVLPVLSSPADLASGGAQLPLDDWLQ